MKIERNGEGSFPLTADDLRNGTSGEVFAATNGSYYIVTDEDTVVDLSDGCQWELGGAYASDLQYREVSAKLIVAS